MIDLDSTMFFKARFDIKAPSGEDALWSLVLSVRDWSLAKARRDGYSMPEAMSAWSDFKNGHMLRSPDARVRIFAALHRADGAYTWACQHIEDQVMTGRAPRRWITEVGFEGASLDRGAVSIITTYSDVPGFIGPLQPEPKANTPGLITSLLGNDRLTCTIDGLDLLFEPVEFFQEDATRIHALLARRDRRVPVILMSPTRAGELPLDPDELVSQVGPNAPVLFTRDCAAAEALNSLLGRDDLSCYGGAVRVYAAHPHFEIPGDNLNHRFFSAADIKAHGAAYYMAILRRALAQDVHAWETAIRIEDVNRLNRNASRERAFRRRAEEIQDMALEQVEEIIEEAERAAQVAEDDCEAAREELKRCKQMVFDLEAKTAWLEHALASAGEGSRNHDVPQALLEASELSIPAIGRLFVELFPDRIDFSERGWESLETCAYDPRAFWSALHSMCTVLHPLYADGAANIAGEFNCSSKFRFSRGEGPQTRGNARLMREREDVYQGRRLFIEPHISSSVGDPNSPQFIRIYFNWDSESGRLVIGDTKHLTNSTTRKL